MSAPATWTPPGYTGPIKIPPALAAGLVKAQATAKLAVCRGTSTDDRTGEWRVFARAADDVVAASKVGLEAGGLALVPLGQDLDDGGRMLTRQVWLVHESGEGVAFTTHFPIAYGQDKAPDSAFSAALTKSLGALHRDTLAIPSGLGRLDEDYGAAGPRTTSSPPAGDHPRAADAPPGEPVEVAGCGPVERRGPRPTHYRVRPAGTGAPAQLTLGWSFKSAAEAFMAGIDGTPNASVSLEVLDEGVDAWVGFRLAPTGPGRWKAEPLGVTSSGPPVIEQLAAAAGDLFERDAAPAPTALPPILRLNAAREAFGDAPAAPTPPPDSRAAGPLEDRPGHAAPAGPETPGEEPARATTNGEAPATQGAEETSAWASTPGSSEPAGPPGGSPPRLVPTAPASSPPGPATTRPTTATSGLPSPLRQAAPDGGETGTSAETTASEGAGPVAPPWDCTHLRQHHGEDSEGYRAAQKRRDEARAALLAVAARCAECDEPMDPEASECPSSACPSRDEDKDSDPVDLEDRIDAALAEADREADAGDVDAMEAVEAQERDLARYAEAAAAERGRHDPAPTGLRCPDCLSVLLVDEAPGFKEERPCPKCDTPLWCVEGDGGPECWLVVADLHSAIVAALDARKPPVPMEHVPTSRVVTVRGPAKGRSIDVEWQGVTISVQTTDLRAAKPSAPARTVDEEAQDKASAADAAVAAPRRRHSWSLTRPPGETRTGMFCAKCGVRKGKAAPPCTGERPAAPAGGAP